MNFYSHWLHYPSIYQCESQYHLPSVDVAGVVAVAVVVAVVLSLVADPSVACKTDCTTN